MSYTILKETAYHCAENGSDKVYFLALRGNEDEGYVVATRYGPRGGRMTEGTKGNSLLPLPDAEKLYDKEHRARLAKGYRVTGGDNDAPANNNTKPDSGLRPQLSNPITLAEAEALILDPAWHVENKYDGERCLLRVSTSRIEGINRKGQVVPVPIEIVIAVRNLDLTPRDTVLDGERIGTTYVPFDILEHDGMDLTSLPRRARVEHLNAFLSSAPSPLPKLGVARTAGEKRAFFDNAKANGEEGVVFKRALAPYIAGRPASGGESLKYKFTASASVRISGINDGKRSVAMEVIDAFGTWISVGNLTVPANKPMPTLGDIVEVRYLYYYQDGALFQPVFQDVRTDLDDAECSLAQLKRKGEASPEAA